MKEDTPQPGAEDVEITEGTGAQAEQAESDADDLDDLGQLDAKTQAYIKKLRKESASYRKKSKTLENNLQTLGEKMGKIEGGLKNLFGGGESETDPAEQIGLLQSQSEQAIVRSAVLESALENGISKEQVGYYEYLLLKRAGELEEGEELGPDEYGQIIAEVKRVGGSAGASSTTSVKTPAAPTPGSRGGVTMDQFLKMTLTERSQLFTRDPETYKTLFSEARTSKKLI